MSGRAAFNIEGTNESYFFHNEKYVRLMWNPDTNEGDTVTHGPAQIIKDWDSLKQAGFMHIDAALPAGNNIVYMFSGKKYCRIEYNPHNKNDKLVGNVQKITDGWPSLKEAKFETVDAALETPGMPNQAYFFCGNKYVRVEFKQDSTDDKILDGPKPISEGWGNLRFKHVSLALPNPKDQQNAFFFSGSKYMQLKLHVGRPDDEIVSDEGNVSDHWPGLKKAGFY